MAASMKMVLFWVVAPCILVMFNNVSEVLAASIIKAMSTQTARCYNPEDSHLRPLPFSQRPSTDSYPEQDKSSPQPYILFLHDPL
jgi:hypothetical protein